MKCRQIYGDTVLHTEERERSEEIRERYTHTLVSQEHTSPRRIPLVHLFWQGCACVVVALCAVWRGRGAGAGGLPAPGQGQGARAGGAWSVARPARARARPRPPLSRPYSSRPQPCLLSRPHRFRNIALHRARQNLDPVILADGMQTALITGQPAERDGGVLHCLALATVC